MGFRGLTVSHVNRILNGRENDADVCRSDAEFLNVILNVFFIFLFFPDIRRHHRYHAVRPALPNHRVLLRPGVAQVERSSQVQAGHVDEKREARRSGTREKKPNEQVNNDITIFLPPPLSKQRGSACYTYAFIHIQVFRNTSFQNVSKANLVSWIAKRFCVMYLYGICNVKSRDFCFPTFRCIFRPLFVS